VQRLTNSKNLRYVVEMDYCVLDAVRLITLISTNDSNRNTSLIDHIGFNNLVEGVSYLSDGRYLANVTCSGLEEFIHLKHYIYDLPGVTTMEVHPLTRNHPRDIRLTKMQNSILRCLLHDPRLHSSKVAAKIKKSAKGVRLAIRRIIRSGMIRFSIQCSFFKYLVRVSYDNKKKDLVDIATWFSNEFGTVWEILGALTVPEIFVTFPIERVDEICNIQKRIREALDIRPIEASICEPMQFFNNIRNDALKVLIGHIDYEEHGI
jgi:hypothetical protein